MLKSRTLVSQRILKKNETNNNEKLILFSKVICQSNQKIEKDKILDQ